ncbi:MAG: type I-E CRISPR-associated protein Cas5/CasD [Methylococcales bacterium]|nr:type I-E CRISPR-associated protein Cas5/CasD [Methylococcales bacterium]
MLANVYFVIRLSGGMQAWGLDSQYTYRNSGLFPSKSGILGLCCAAQGLDRGSDAENEWLSKASSCGMTAISIPKLLPFGDRKTPISVRRIEDFHTVANTKTAKGDLKDALTYRQYICDAEFIVLLYMPTGLANNLKADLENPKWGVWLGRKACIPSAPVFAGICENIEEVSHQFLSGKPLQAFTYQQEVKSFQEGTDTLNDIPVCFSIESRSYKPRRLLTHEAEII